MKGTPARSVPMHLIGVARVKDAAFSEFPREPAVGAAPFAFPGSSESPAGPDSQEYPSMTDHSPIAAGLPVETVSPLRVLINLSRADKDRSVPGAVLQGHDAQPRIQVIC